jgi:hypothetical protein
MSLLKVRVEWEHKVISDKIDLETGLVKPGMFDWLPKPYITDLEARRYIAEEVPADGVEVVGWMHGCAAANAVLAGVMEDYNRLGSQLVTTSSDGYIPGTSVSSDFNFKSQSGSVVNAQGYSVMVTPVGNFNVPKNGCVTVAQGKFLGWGATTRLESVQWKGTLMKWASLASKPVSQSVPHANIDGLVAPQFFNIPAPLALPVNTTTVKLTSDKPQTVTFRGRSTADYGKVNFEFQQSIPAGESSVTYRVWGRPRTTAHILEIQPQNGTATVVNSIS